jgi:putative FmdB family regulatory protein
VIYPYACQCGHEFEVIKRIAEIDRPEICPKCSSSEVKRYISRTHFYGACDWDKAEYNPGLGKVVRNSQHRKELAKSMGVEEIGNEPVSKIHAKYDVERSEKLARNWEKAKETALHGV